MRENSAAPVRVLVADDSPLAREMIVGILATDVGIRIIGEAGNGRQAVKMVSELKPDIVTMDIEMPVMGGIEAIELIMAETPVPILVVTSLDDASIACEAVSRGALDFIRKPEIAPDCAREFVHRIKLLSRIKVLHHMVMRKSASRGGPRTGAYPLPPGATRVEDGGIVAIASSTGGPQALSVILSGLTENFPWPLVVAQHIPEGFAQGLAEFLGKISKLRVKIGERNEPLKAGTVYLSPPETNMEVSGAKKIAMAQWRQGDIYHPSCDVLLSSVASVYGDRGVGIILTGMGSDGADGIKKIKEAGGRTIAQDEKTSVVFGMNKVAIDNGGARAVLALDRIAPELMRIARA